MKKKSTEEQQQKKDILSKNVYSTGQARQLQHKEITGKGRYSGTARLLSQGEEQHESILRTTEIGAKNF